MSQRALRLHEKGDKRRTIGLHFTAGSGEHGHYQGPGDKRRTIGLQFTAAQAISEYLAKAELASGPLFRPRLGPRSQKLANRFLEASAMYGLIQRYLERLPGALKEEQLADGSVIRRCIYTPHSLRATTATLLLDATVDILRVQNLLGHKHITTTQIYDKRRRTPRSTLPQLEQTVTPVRQ